MASDSFERWYYIRVT